MKTIQIFDPPLCCSTGVCGSEVDQAVVDFAAAVDWAKRRGVHIERFNLAQQPLAFAENDTVRVFLKEHGDEALPLVLIENEIVLAGRYPSRAELAERLTGDDSEQASAERVCDGGRTTRAGTKCCGG